MNSLVHTAGMIDRDASGGRSVARRSLTRRLGWVAARTPMLLAAAPQAAIGGQAVMDGVMMRGPHSWAIAVRRYDGTIAVQHRELVSFASRHRWARLPLVRGVVALLEALVIGMKALFVSSEYAMEAVEAEYAEREASAATPNEAKTLHAQGIDRMHEVERTSHHAAAASGMAGPVQVPHDPEAARDPHEAPDPDKLGTVAIVVSMMIAIGFSVALFKIVPVTLVTLLPIDRNAWAFVIVEAVIKFAIFCVYLLLIGMMADMRRVFQYHSAEHKAINAWERGVPLDPGSVNQMSRIHVRCGTAFIVWLFLVGLVVFRVAQLTFLEDASRLEIILSRPVLLPIIAGLSFELLRFAGRHADNVVLRMILAPGLWFQRLTTRECTPEQCEVAISSLNAVLEHERGRDGAASTDRAGRGGTADSYELLA